MDLSLVISVLYILRGSGSRWLSDPLSIYKIYEPRSGEQSKQADLHGYDQAKNWNEDNICE